MNLLMLTKFYPFGNGEAFIENEIKVMAEYYNKITIIACEASETDKVRNIPSNVKAYKVLKKTKKIDVINGIIHLKNRDENFKKEKKQCTNFIQKFFLDYFEEKSYRIYGNIVELGVLDEIVKEPYVLYSYWLFMTARVGILIAQKSKPVYMFTRAHRYDLYDGMNRIGYLPYRRLFLEKYNNIFPCSQNGENYLKEKYPLYSEKIQTALLGTLDHGEGYKSDDDVYRLVSCSRVESVKRVERIVETLLLLDNTGMKISWTHIGAGSGYEKLKKEAKKLQNIETKFYGDMKNMDVMKLYATHPFDLLINVSSSEGLPVSIMEAISFGIPCVGTDVGGTSEIVIDGITGKLIECNFKNEDLALIIKKFAESKNDLRERKLCRKYWKENFQANENYHRLYKFISNQIERDY